MNYFKIARFFLYMPVLLMTVIVTKSTLFPFIVGKYVFFRATVLVALIVFLLGLLFDAANAPRMWARLGRIVRQPLFIAVSAFTLAFLLSCLFGVDPAFSFWSNFERGEGGLQTLAFYFYFTLLLALFDKREHWNALVGCAIAGGVLMGLYGFMASLGVSGFVGLRFSEGYRFQGSIGNPAYVAVYALFLIFYCLYLMFEKKTEKFLTPRNLGLFALIAFFVSIFFLAGTRGAFLGLGTAGVALLAYIGFSYKRFRWKIAGLIALLFIVGGGLIYFQDSPVVKSIPGSRVFQISISAKTFQDRVVIWKMAWDGFKERPVFGWGPENFIKIFDSKFNTEFYKPEAGFGAWFDRAHSVIFDYLAETGLVGFLSYVSMFVMFYVTFARRNKERESQLRFTDVAVRGLFFAIPLAYFVQGLVLFDVSVTSLNLFTVLALATFRFGLNGQENMKTQEHKNKRA